MKKQAKFRPIAPPIVLFTERERLRLTLMRWLYRRGRISEWKV